ncbi:MAG: hypothetical protein MJB14_00440 [Spirochaetes bacterium]|nr:hypothetical protein [Spirochaetota bacterium]
MKKKIITRDFFIDYLKQYYSLSDQQINHLMEDFQQFYQHNLNDFIQLRHQALKHAGLKNEEIYQKILSEIKEQRFSVSDLSLRQIRRIIYG